MELTVLGTSAAFPAPGRACSGYLVRSDETTLLVDLGSGVLSNLQKHVPLSAIDAVLISHLHADHFLDLYLLQVYLQFDVHAERALPVYGPAGADERINVLQPKAAQAFYQYFDFRPWEEGKSTEIGDFIVSTRVAKHAERTYAMRFECEGATITYTADTGPSPTLEKLAGGTGLLIAESSWLERPLDAAVGHLTAAEAGEMADRAGARELVLTHFWPGMDRERAAELARGAFSGPVHLAEEGRTFVVT